ncbi:MAG: SRPBCC family protein [Mucilaginibacter sp.]
MTATDFTTTIVVDQTPEEVFNAITNVRGWWSENIKGGTSKAGDEFNYSYQDIHRCTMRLTEVVPYQKIEWLVLDNYFSFITDQAEWKGNKISFQISEKGKQTQLFFTHFGLVPEYECYEICFEAWTGYIENSLYNLITTGKGEPNPKEDVVA